MPRRPTLFAALLAFVLAGCAPNLGAFGPEGEGETGPRFVTHAVDVKENAGVGIGLDTDGQGAPNVSYLRLDEQEAIPAAPQPADPQFIPAVIVASYEAGIWTRTIVAQESSRGAYAAAVEAAEAAGTDPPERPEFTEENIPAKFEELSIEDTTDVAVAGSGLRHVVWTNGNAAIQYATDEGGGFLSGPDDPVETIHEGSQLSGVSIAVADDGTPWVAFLEGSQMMLGSLTEAGWEFASAGSVEGSGDGVRSDLAAGPDGPVAAFGGTRGATLVVPGEEGPTAEPAAGESALGISLALDGDDPIIAYVTEDGTVKAGGDTVAEDAAPLTLPSPTATPGPGTPEPPEPPVPATGITLDDEGNVWVAWSDAEGIRYARSDEGLESHHDIPASGGGVAPHLAQGADGPVAAWYQFDSTSAAAAIFTEGEVEFAIPSPEAPVGGGGRPQCEPEGTELTIVAPPGASSNGFDTTCLAALSGTPFSVLFRNDDPNVAHNWSAYVDQTAEELVGGPGTTQDFITGVDETTYDVDALEEGTYFYRCDLHPTSMTGTLLITVEGEDGGGESPAAEETPAGGVSPGEGDPTPSPDGGVAPQPAGAGERVPTMAA